MKPKNFDINQIDSQNIIDQVANELRKSCAFQNFNGETTLRNTFSTQYNPPNNPNKFSTKKVINSVVPHIIRFIFSLTTVVALYFLVYTYNSGILDFEPLLDFIRNINADLHARSVLAIIILSSSFSLYYTIHSLQKFYYYLTDENQTNSTPTSNDPFHDDITIKVYRRLILRNAVLSETERFSTSSYSHETQYLNDEDAKNNPKRPWIYTISRMSLILHHFRVKKININKTKQNTPPPPDLGKINKTETADQPFTRSYNLAVTDLFVEKALAYLNRKARIYSRQGFFLITIAFIAISIGAWTAFFGMKDLNYLYLLINNKQSSWELIIAAFTKSFTFYGLIILIAVYAGRFGKALFDQAERMKDRRHSLRQGRLYVHLNGGKLTIDELDKAFNWNTSQSNAFFHFNPEAQAPWGNMFKEMMITMRETAKSSMELTKSLKKDG